MAYNGYTARNRVRIVFQQTLTRDCRVNNHGAVIYDVCKMEAYVQASKKQKHPTRAQVSIKEARAQIEAYPLFR